MTDMVGWERERLIAAWSKIAALRTALNAVADDSLEDDFHLDPSALEGFAFLAKSIEDDIRSIENDGPVELGDYGTKELERELEGRKPIATAKNKDSEA